MSTACSRSSSDFHSKFHKCIAVFKNSLDDFYRQQRSIASDLNNARARDTWNAKAFLLSRECSTSRPFFAIQNCITCRLNLSSNLGFNAGSSGVDWLIHIRRIYWNSCDYFFSFHSLRSLSMDPYFRNYYVKTHLRMSSYLVGVIAGAILYDHQKTNWRISKVRFFFCINYFLY